MAKPMNMDELMTFAAEKRRAAEAAAAAGRLMVARELQSLVQRAERMIQSAAEQYFVQGV